MPTPFCRDCKHMFVKKGWFTQSEPLCGRKEYEFDPEYDVVTGKLKRKAFKYHLSCASQRKMDDSLLVFCGYTGRHFEPKGEGNEVQGRGIRHSTPLNKWDEKDADKIIPYMSYSSFGLTAPQAWSKQVQISITEMEFSKRVQKWHDVGYRLKKVTLTIEMSEDE